MLDISEFITDYCCSKKIIPEDRKDIYCYGFRLIFADIINFLIIITLGLIINRLIESICFLICFCTLRQFSGGFHAKTFTICRISFVLVYLSLIYLTSVASNIETGYVVLLNILVTLFIAVFAPIEHPNKPMTAILRKRNKTKAIITSSILSVVSICLANMDKRLGVTISFTLCAVAILMLISMLQRKGGVGND